MDPAKLIAAMKLSDQLAELLDRLKELEREAQKLRLENKSLRSELREMETAPGANQPWVVLGINEAATEDEIGKAFRVMSRRFHPDNKGTGDPEKFQQVLAARTAMLQLKARRR